MNPRGSGETGAFSRLSPEPCAMPRMGNGDTATRRVLIVDDESCLGWIWAAALRRAGYQLSIATDANAGWDEIFSASPDLVIVNQDGAVRTGRDLIVKIRLHANPVPCILVSDTLQPDGPAVLRWLEPGRAFAKPLAVSELLHAARMLLHDMISVCPVPGTARD